MGERSGTLEASASSRSTRRQLEPALRVCADASEIHELMTSKTIPFALLGLIALGACTVAEAPYPPMPPPPTTEIIPKPPVSEQPLIWEPGHYDWTGNAYLWQSGKYVPRDGHSMWMPGYWSGANGSYVWVPAHWM
jgi:WXXGXW repeat (2 copies)